MHPIASSALYGPLRGKAPSPPADSRRSFCGGRGLEGVLASAWGLEAEGAGSAAGAKWGTGRDGPDAATPPSRSRPCSAPPRRPHESRPGARTASAASRDSVARPGLRGGRRRRSREAGEQPALPRQPGEGGGDGGGSPSAEPEFTIPT